MNDKDQSSHTQYFEIAKRWWSDTKDNKGAMARIRRANKELDVIQIPEALLLVRRLGDKRHRQAAILAGVLSHVRGHEETPLMRKLGRKDLSKKEAKLSETRFKRLIQCEQNELLDPLRRIVQMNDGLANVDEMCKLVLWWDENKKTKLIFDYYAVWSQNQNSSTPNQKDATAQSDTP